MPLVFSAAPLLKNKLGFRDSLRYNLYNHPALIPVLKKENVSAPAGLSIVNDGSRVSLQWSSVSSTEAKYYVLYKSNSRGEIDYNNPAFIYALIPTTRSSFSEELKEPSAVYALSVVDRYGNESVPVRFDGNIIAGGYYDRFDESAPFYAYKKENVIKIKIPERNYVSLRIYTRAGYEAGSVFAGFKEAGEYTFDIDTNKYKPGVYYYQLKSGNNITSGKMIIN